MAWILLAAMPAGAAEVHAILASPRQRATDADFSVTGHLVKVDASGARTSDGVTIEARGFPGVLRILVNITSPRQAREKILLEMRPNGQDVIKIAHPGDKAPATIPLEKWSDGPLGPGFSYEDFLEQQYFWPGQTALGEVKYGARDCDLVKSTPGAADKTQYSQVKTWLDHTISFPVFVEKTVKGTGAVKEFTYYGLRHNEGVWSASQVEEKTRGQAGSSLLIIDRGTAKANLGLKEFSPEQLTHFQD
jgi:hypothetical protein